MSCIVATVQHIYIWFSPALPISSLSKLNDCAIPSARKNMESAAFGDSNIQDSTVNAGSFNHSRIYINVYGDNQTARRNTEYRSNGIQNTRSRVTFTDQEMGEIRNSYVNLSKIPASISRLLNKGESVQVPEPADPMEHSSYSGTDKTATTAPHFMAIEEDRQTMKDKLKLRVEGAFIQKYMRSDFFVSATAIPLWDPSPGINSPKAIKTRNVCVGDVGFFTPDGGFDVLFNAFLSHTDNKELGLDPPDNFKPYGPVRFAEQVSKITRLSCTNHISFRGDFAPDQEIPHHPERKYITSYHLVEKHGKNSVRSGTLLDLPDGAWRDQMLVRTLLKMQGYFGRHAESWYNYYLKRPGGPTIPKGYLNIVSGSYKCSTWALAFCSTTFPDNIFARLYQLYPDSKFYYEWDLRGPVVGKRGPLSAKIGDDGLPVVNQCVAVEVHSIKLSPGGIQKVGASLGNFMSGLSIRSRSSNAKSRIPFWKKPFSN